MASTTSTVTTRDGTVLLVRHWEPSGAAPSGAAAFAQPLATALLVHGLSEHSGRYERVGGWLAQAGIDVQAYDQRGWGGSSGRRGDVERWDDLLDDLAVRLDQARAGARGPVFIYGHSLGGLVTTSYLVSGRPLPDLAVLSAPGIDSAHGRGVRLLAAVAGRLAPTVRPPVVPEHWDALSRDPSVGEAFRVDPFAVHDPTARFGAISFREQRRTRDALNRMLAAGQPFPVPTLVIHGSDDRVVPCAASEVLAEFPNVTRRVHPGIRHELHNEPEGETIVGGVIEWVREQAARAEVA